jgi:hypothetical protein
MKKSADHPPLSLVGPGLTVLEPPRRLGEPGRSLWDRVQREFRINDAGGIELLTLAGESLDRAERLKAAIERDGEIVRTSQGLKAHPGVREELATLEPLRETEGANPWSPTDRLWLGGAMR